MKSASESLTRSALLGVGAGVLAAGCVFWALSSMAKPAAFDARSEALESRLAKVKAQAAAGPASMAFAAGTLCAQAPERAAAAIAEQLNVLAGQTQLSLTEVNVAPAARTGRLAPVEVRFKGQGGYDAALHLIEALGRHRPEVFIDHVALTSRVAFMELEFSGRAYCRTPA